MAAVTKAPCFPCASTSPYSRRASSQLSLPRSLSENRPWSMRRRGSKVNASQYGRRMLSSTGRVSKRRSALLAVSEDRVAAAEVEIDAPEDSDQYSYIDDLPSVSIHLRETGGRPGLLSFYNHPYKREDKDIVPISQGNDSNISWFVGPAVLVASFILPSLYLRKIISIVFEDSLLTDFLILFFTEALFYGGVAVYLLVTDRLCRNSKVPSTVTSKIILGPRWADRIASVSVLSIRLIIPMVTVGVVWPWTGPAASATLAPIIVGIVVQFAFEQYARYVKSPSWSIIPIVFQIYRLHQLNRAAQLVTALSLSLTVRGTEMTAHSFAIIKSLGTLLNVLQFLGVICIWSLSSFISRGFSLLLRSLSNELFAFSSHVVPNPPPPEVMLVTPRKVAVSQRLLFSMELDIERVCRIELVAVKRFTTFGKSVLKLAHLQLFHNYVQLFHKCGEYFRMLTHIGKKFL